MALSWEALQLWSQEREEAMHFIGSGEGMGRGKVREMNLKKSATFVRSYNVLTPCLRTCFHKQSS